MAFLVPKISSTLEVVWQFLANPKQLGFECQNVFTNSESPLPEGQIAVIIVYFCRSKSLFKSGSRSINSL